jgi:predicted RNase H-like HicB family nuclease
MPFKIHLIFGKTPGVKNIVFRFLNWYNDGGGKMEIHFRLKIEKLPEDVFLATSDDVPGLVAQGRTIDETIEIARDVARRVTAVALNCQLKLVTGAALREGAYTNQAQMVPAQDVGSTVLQS